MRKDLIMLKKMYDRGDNILSFIRKNRSSKENTPMDILVTYDLQAGNYIKDAKQHSEYENERASLYSNIINELGGFDSILEVGVGEGTMFANILPRLNSTKFVSAGFDISFSRIQYGQHYLNDLRINSPLLFVGDLFNAPIQSHSLDIVYTHHALEPNGGHEIAALVELYRITKKYLVLFEPIYEFASDEAREYMDQHSYVRDLHSIATKLGYKVVDYRLIFEKNYSNSNNTGVMIIEKINNGNCGDVISNRHTIPLACPVTKKPLEKVRDNYYCKDSMLLYPVINSIPCLLPNNAIVATHFLDNIFRDS